MSVLNPSVCFPDFKALNASGVPAELIGYDQWICWKLEQTSDNPKKKPTKVPYSALSGRKSGITEKFRNSSWSSFEVACAAYGSGQYGGVSFAITEQDPFVVIDFDHCVTNGIIHADALAWINKLGSYAEISPSGTGVHILLRGKKPGSRCTNKKGDFEIEVYEKGRFITITGHVIENYCGLTENQDALSELYFDKLHIPEPEPVKYNPEIFEPVTSDDVELIRKIKDSKQGIKFERLISGDTSGYGNDENEGHSEADLALCMILAYWTQKDADRINRIFVGSGLMRDKWFRSAGDCSYGERTIRESLKRTTEVYTGKKTGSKAVKGNVVPISDANKEKKSRKLRTCHITESAFQPSEALYDTASLPWPDTGSYYFISPVTGDLHVGGSDSEPGEIIAQAPIWVHARAKNLFGEYSLVIKFYNYDNQETTLTFPAAILSDVGGMLGRQIRALGMPLIAGKEKMVNRYIDQMAKWCKKSGWIAEKIGWFEGSNPPVFVLPSSVIGRKHDDPEIFYQPSLQQDVRSLSAKGSLDEWQTKVADKTKKNPLLLFGIMAALAGPLNKLAKGESGAFHFCGETSTGKTAIAQAAASVWGDASDPQNMADRTSIRKWKSTVSGLEAFAQLHNDIVLCLDEIGGTRPEDVSEAIYLLTGGIPKGRSQADGGSRRQPTWHTLLISTGELTIEQVLNQAGQEQKGGQRHRMPDIRCDTTTTGVVYDPDIKTLGERAKFVSVFKDNCSIYYGTAGPAFVSWILSQFEDKGLQGFTDELVDNVDKYKRYLIEDIGQLPSEGLRMLNRLSIIGVAGMYASEIGILNITLDDINSSILTVRNLWMDNMDAHKSEAERTIDYFKHNVMTNIGAFINVVEFQTRIPNKVYGYQNSDFIMILVKSLDVLCGSHPKSAVLRALKDSNSIVMGEIDKRTNKRRMDKKACFSNSQFPDRPRCYHIHRSFFE